VTRAWDRGLSLVAAAGLALAACGTAAGDGQPATSAAAGPRAAKAQEVSAVRGYLQRVVLEMATRRGRRDTQFLSAGVWHSSDERCWRCNVGPGTAAAVLWRSGTWRRPYLLRVAETTFDRAIADHRRPDGSFGPKIGGEFDNEITTMFFGVELGIAYHELRTALDPARARRWQEALAGAARYLSDRLGGHYVNGNINLGASLLYQLTADATADPQWQEVFARSLQFTLHPPALRAALGLRYAKKPKKADGSDGKGFLAEQGDRGAGYDAEYTQLQSDMLARLYALHPGARYLRLLNVLTNQLLDRVDGQFRLHTQGGTRHGAPGSVVPFTTTALPVLAFAGHRDDLRRRALGQLARVRHELSNALEFPYGNSNRMVGLESTVLMALAPPVPAEEAR
jgi:hypothetical protein